MRHFFVLLLLITILKTSYTQVLTPIAVSTILTNTYPTSGGMGEAGIAIAPKTNAIFFNSSKIVFNEDNTSASLSFTPLLRNIGIADIYIANLSGFSKLNDFQAVGAALRYYSLGNYTYLDGNDFAESKHRDFTFDIAYSHKLNEQLGLGANLKFINSNLGVSNDSIKIGRALAIDLSAFYTKPISLSNYNGQLNVGASISNMGNKITYFDDQASRFLPAKLGIGAAYTLLFDNECKLTLTYDMNKLLVPTSVLIGELSDKNVLGGMLSSFADAPFETEIRELTHSLGTEFWILDYAAIRTGLYRENLLGQKVGYGTFGFSLKYKPVEITASRIFDADKFSPWNKTTRISVLMHL